MRRLAAFAATAALAVSGLLGYATPAAAATCFEATCDGKVLANTDCATNDYSIDDFFVGSDQSIALWYSPGCHAFWGEYNLTTSGGTSVALYGIPLLGGYSVVLDQYVSFSGPGKWETKLHTSKQSAKFCWSQQPGDPGDSQTAIGGCTKWR